MTSWAIVREARRRAGLTQRELAARAGTSQSAIARLERGRQIPSVETLTMTARAGWLDLCTRPAGGQSYDTLAPNAQTYELFGFRVRVASLDDVIRSKEAASRDKDLRSLATLRDLQKRLGS